MKRRVEPMAAPKLPRHLAEFDPEAWADLADFHCEVGWFHEARRRWYAERLAWARQAADKLHMRPDDAVDLLPESPVTPADERFCGGCI